MDVLDVMRDRKNICNYLDMPLQHGSTKMLKAMKRGITREKTDTLVASFIGSPAMNFLPGTLHRGAGGAQVQLHDGTRLDAPPHLASQGAVDGQTVVFGTRPEHLTLTDAGGIAARVVEGHVRLEQSQGHEWIARLVEAFPGRILSIRLGQPTLEDVFIAQTGHRFWRERAEAAHG